MSPLRDFSDSFKAKFAEFLFHVVADVVYADTRGRTASGGRGLRALGWGKAAKLLALSQELRPRHGVVVV